jgi:hypothetical protein
MNRKSLIGGLVGLLLLTGIIGSNLVMAAGNTDTAPATKNEATVDNDNLDCPAQGLPACQGQMNDDQSEGPENEADDANEADEANEAKDSNEADDPNEANEKSDGPEDQGEVGEQGANEGGQG